MVWIGFNQKENNMSTTTIGTRRDDIKKREVSAEDPFRDAPFYAAGYKGDKMNPINVGDLICGTFHSLRSSKSSDAQYLCLELGNGDLIRVMAPIQLRNTLTNEGVEKGQYVELEYKGMIEPTNEGGRSYHSFDVRIGEGTVN
jgi:hypothetical protein